MLILVLGLYLNGIVNSKAESTPITKPMVETIEVETIEVENIDVETWDTVPIQSY